VREVVVAWIKVIEESEVDEELKRSTTLRPKRRALWPIS
jgi:hypothetical protein